MPKISTAPHDAESLKALADWLIDRGGKFAELAARYATEGSPTLAVQRDDMRKRAIPFINSFLDAAVQSLDNHLEQTGKFAAKSAKPKPKKAEK